MKSPDLFRPSDPVSVTTREEFAVLPLHEQIKTLDGKINDRKERIAQEGVDIQHTDKGELVYQIGLEVGSLKRAYETALECGTDAKEILTTLRPLTIDCFNRLTRPQTA